MWYSMIYFLERNILGITYYYGLVMINYGIIRMYFFIMIFIGYLFFMDFYKTYILLAIEKSAKFTQKIMSVIYFFFKRINAILRKEMS